MKKQILFIGALVALSLVSCNKPSSSSLLSSSSEMLSSFSSESLISSISEYTVTWIVDGNVSYEKYNEGEMPSYKYGTSKESDKVYSYTFTGWDKELVPVVEDTTYTAQYSETYIDYTITWVVDGQETKETYHYGDTPVFKGSTEKAKDAQYTYTFKCWDKELAPVEENTTYTAVFDTELNKYTVTFIVDGVEVKVDYYYGETPQYDKTPEKEANEQYHYTFTGWDKEFVPVTENVTYTAVFREDINQYTITWVVGLDTFSEDYNYGETPSFKGDTTREDSAKYHYTFTGWDKDISVVTGNETYVAQYDSEIRKYNVNFYSESGELLFTKEYEYDQVPQYQGEVPSKSQTNYYTYTFNGWRCGDSVYDAELPPVIGETNYYANYAEAAREFTVTIRCLNLDGTQIGEPTIVKKTYGESYEIQSPVVDNKTADRQVIKGSITGDVEEVIYYSDVSVYDGTSISASLSGSGTQEDPYLITSGDDLAFLKEEINVNSNYYADNYFKMTKSIDLTNASNFVIGSSSAVSFAGKLDANHCSIIGLNVSGTAVGRALFCALSASASIEYLSVYGTVSGAQYSGGIVGRNLGTLSHCYNYVDVSHKGSNGCGGVAGGNAGTINECINYGTVTTTDTKEKIGGISGVGETSGVFTNCINYGQVKGNNYVGGIVGEFQNKATKVEQCINYGKIIGGKRTGGITGASGALVTNCINKGEVTSETTGDLYIGGISGAATSTSKYISCTNDGIVHASGRYLGGIVGCTGSNSSPTITNCVNNGEITSTSNGVGGILGGTLNSGPVTITGCANHGAITGADKVGGIVGALTAGTESDNTNDGLITNNVESGYDILVGSDYRNA